MFGANERHRACGPFLDRWAGRERERELASERYHLVGS